MGREWDEHLPVGYKRIFGSFTLKGEVTVIGTEGGRGIHDEFWIV